MIGETNSEGSLSAPYAATRCLNRYTRTDHTVANGVGRPSAIGAVRKGREKSMAKHINVDDMNGWESPVELIYEEIKKKTDDFILAQCGLALGVKVDKDELIKAMNYDREQYKKGFANGYKQKEAEIVRCKDCEYGGDYDVIRCLYHGTKMSRDEYCSCAERRECK